MPYWGSAGGASPDNVTLEINANGKLQIKNGGVGTTQIADAGVTQSKLNAPVMELLGSETLTSSNANITVSGLTTTDYDAIFVVVHADPSGLTDALLRINGATTNYEYQQITADGSTSAGEEVDGTDGVYCGQWNNNGGMAQLAISQGLVNVNVTGVAGCYQGETVAVRGSRKSTARVTSLTFRANSGSWNTGSRMYVYGVPNS